MKVFLAFPGSTTVEAGMSMNNIRKIITDKGLTVPEAARVCGLPVSTVSAHYYGQRKSMTLQIAAKYARGFGVQMDDLFKGIA